MSIENDLINISKDKAFEKEGFKSLFGLISKLKKKLFFLLRKAKKRD